MFRLCYTQGTVSCHLVRKIGYQLQEIFSNQLGQRIRGMVYTRESRRTTSSLIPYPQHVDETSLSLFCLETGYFLSRTGFEHEFRRFLLILWLRLSEVNLSLAAALAGGVFALPYTVSEHGRLPRCFDIIRNALSADPKTSQRIKEALLPVDTAIHDRPRRTWL